MKNDVNGCHEVAVFVDEQESTHLLEVINGCVNVSEIPKTDNNSMTANVRIRFRVEMEKINDKAN